MRIALLFAIGYLLIGCGGDSQVFDPVSIQFRSETFNILETKTAESILLTLESPAPFDGEVEILITEFNARYGESFITQPMAVDQVITIPFAAGSTQISFAIAPVQDANSVVDSLALSINTTASVQGLTPSTSLVYLTEDGNSGGGNNGSGASCNPIDYPAGSVLCSPSLRNDHLDIVTWNIENFPMTAQSVIKVVEIIEAFDADIYAIQEIDEISSFNAVVDALDAYEGIATNVRGGIELGYIYKSDEITRISTPIQLFEGQTSPFPREPVEVDITHINGLTVKLINLHLKCCDDGISRRANASMLLQSYLDNELHSDEVVVLGDWNEDLVNGSGSFQNFIDEPDNYLFADYPINQGSNSNFSYQLFNPKSHLDHLLITNELCDNLVSSYTAKLDECISNYYFDVSDHRPVMISLQAD